MIFLKTDDEIELLRQSNLLVGKTLAEVAKLIKPGVTTKELDKVAEEFIRDNGAIPTFKGFPNQNGDPFPSTLCTSVNDQVVHGIPNDIPLKEGDIVSVDCGTYMNGFCGDSAYTFCVGEVDPEIRKLLKTTKEALYLGIENAIHGKRLGDIGYAIQQYCESNTYGVLLRVPGIGTKSAFRIVKARRHGTLNFEHLKKMGVVLKRAKYFITCSGKMMYRIPIEEDFITRQLIGEDAKQNWEIDHPQTYRQLSLFDDFNFQSKVTIEDSSKTLFGQM